MRDFNIVYLNMVHIFDVLLNGLYVERSCNLISGYDDTCLIRLNEVCYDFGFDILEYSVNVDNVSTRVFHELHLVVIAYCNNDLLS